MMNMVYQFEKMRMLLDEFEPSRELSLARTKLEECELWLSKCNRTEEALIRDQAPPETGIDLTEQLPRRRPETKTEQAPDPRRQIR